jgi:hypothetical protein
VSNLTPVKVSLGIPVYNGERFVATAIQSALDPPVANLFPLAMFRSNKEVWI